MEGHEIFYIVGRRALFAPLTDRLKGMGIALCDSLCAQGPASCLLAAERTLHKYGRAAPRLLLSSAPRLGRRALFEKQHMQKALQTAARLAALARELTLLDQRLAFLREQKARLMPYIECALPLDEPSGRDWTLQHISLKKKTDIVKLAERLARHAPLSELFVFSRDTRTHGLLVAHKSQWDTALALLRDHDCIEQHFTEKGTAIENSIALQGQIAQLAARRAALASQVAALRPYRGLLRLCARAAAPAPSALRFTLRRAAVPANPRLSRGLFYLAAVVPAQRKAEVVGYLQQNGLYFTTAQGEGTLV